MSSDAALLANGGDPTALSLEELLAVKPAQLRDALGRGGRGPDGERPGRGRAQSLDFDGLAPYVAGDDVRSIDWRASLRSGETMARRYAAASHRARMIVLELSPDLHFGTRDRVMAKTAALTAAWLAWRALALNEPTGLMAGDVILPPRRGRRHVIRVLEAVLQAFQASINARPDPGDLATAAAMLGQQDEICLVGEMPFATDGMVQVGRALSPTRVLKFYLVEDPMMRAAVPRGRYPVRGPDGNRMELRVSKDDGEAEIASAALENVLVDSGWQTSRALDLLPKGVS